eukprot:TRINITY_DN3653_c0_g1_i1.p1 TRINITY_DN3653_c0_g1~~TRINITY_DN3653_c0_g1_i1.p1  ORF type:complete len:316 (-),score=67.59 TRINITY_DN3653_c0_g1_i1:182-1129(-)
MSQFSFNTAHQIDNIKFSSNNELFAVATSNLNGAVWDGEVIVFECKDNRFEKVHSFRTETGNPDVSWLGDKNKLIACATDDGSVNIWDLNAHLHLSQSLIEHDDIVTTLDTHSTEKHTLLSGSWDNKIKLWDTNKSSHSVLTFHGHSHHVTGLQWNPTELGIFASTSEDGTIKVWDKSTNKAFETINTNFRGSKIPVYSLSWSKVQSNLLAVGSEEGDLTLFDTRNTKVPLWSDTPHKASVRKLSFNSKKQQLITGSDDKTSIVYDLSNNSNVQKIGGNAHKDFVRGVAWNNVRTNFYLTASWDRTITLNTIKEK